MRSNIRSIKGIIFDLDGVVLSTDRYHYLAWERVAARLGVPFSEAVNDRLRGVSRMDCIEVLLESYTGAPLTQAEKTALATRKNEDYRFHLRKMTPADVANEVRETLGELRRRGYRTAIGSVSQNAKFILEKTEMLPYFDAVSDGTNITRSKPDPEVFLKAAEFIGVAPSDCAVVEDAMTGIEAAARGGMLPVAIGSAAESPLAAYKISAFSDLLDLFP